MEPKKDRSSEMFWGTGRFLMASALPTKSCTPCPEILKNRDSISDWKNPHFPHFTTILFLSRIVRILLTFFCVPPEVPSMPPKYRLYNSLRTACSLKVSPWPVEIRWAYHPVRKIQLKTDMFPLFCRPQYWSYIAYSFFFAQFKLAI